MTRQFKTIEAYFEEWPEDKKVAHEFIWYVEPELTMEQWIKLDDAMGDAFEAAGISLDDVVGVAGPIPFDNDPEEVLGSGEVSVSAEEFFAKLEGEENE